ncbi:MAG: sugar phosphate isomerase/epimerase [Gorillibacterium sp.]|nr:sugar phosphate isomerase/epimerase [Gorillibacterium sp.]
MKLAVFTVMLPDFGLNDTLAVLKKTGYDGVEWRVTVNNPASADQEPSFWGNNHSTIDPSISDEELGALKVAQDAAGLLVPNLGCYIPVGDLKLTEQGMKIAKVLGAPSIRVGVSGYDRSISYRELLEQGRHYLHGVQELSQQYGVKGNIEIHHGNIASSASSARRLVEGFDPAHIGVIHDAGNMVHEGYENYRMGLEILGEYLAHVHVKNAAWACSQENIKSPGGSPWKSDWAPLKTGVVDLGQLMADVQHIGYDGWLSFEDFSSPHPDEASLVEQAAYIRSLLK